MWRFSNWYSSSTRAAIRNPWTRCSPASSACQFPELTDGYFERWRLRFAHQAVKLCPQVLPEAERFFNSARVLGMAGEDTTGGSARCRASELGLAERARRERERSRNRESNRSKRSCAGTRMCSGKAKTKTK